MARAIIPRLALAAGATLLALLLVELGLRLGSPWGAEQVAVPAFDEIPPDFYEADPVLKRRNRPGQDLVFTTVESRVRLRTDERGLRGPAPRSGALDVLFLGDSFVFGAQVAEEDTVSEQLEAPLGAAAGRPVDVLNGGVNAWGTWQELRLLRETDLRPAAVVLGFYLGNDLLDNAAFLSGDAQVAPAAEGRPRRARGLNTRIGRWSRTWATLLALHEAWRPDPGLVAMLRQELHQFADPAALAALLPPTRQALVKFERTCRERGVPCLVALVPPAWAIDADRRAPTLAVVGMEGSHLDYEGAARAVADLAPPGLVVVDLAPALRAAEGPLYFRFDPHWTPRGHAAAARALAPAVARALGGG